MTARDDYPPLHASSGSAEMEWEAMCVEIDRLRKFEAAVNDALDQYDASKSKRIRGIGFTNYGFAAFDCVVAIATAVGRTP